MAGITFIVLLGNKEVYDKCFLASPLFQSKHRLDFQIIAQQGFASAGRAFNDGIDRAAHDRIVCVHQDVILPTTWAARLSQKLRELEAQHVPLGVVGCWGITAEGERAGHVYHRDRQLFPRVPGDNGNRGPMSLPKRVQTLDELLISFRKSSGLRFDPDLPSFFGYAVDICLTAEAKGLQNFAIDCPCIHETVDQRRVRKELAESATYLMEKWSKLLPIPTPTGALEGKWALWRDRMKLRIQDSIGYTPAKMWWERLPKVDPREILFDETSLANTSDGSC